MRVMIGTPSYDGRLQAQYVDALITTRDLCNKTGIEVHAVFLCNDALIQKARNDLFKMAYDSKVDFLFFIDSDISWNPTDFIKVLLREEDFVLCAYPYKAENSGFVLNALDKVPDVDILEVAGGGTGFMRISRNVIKQMYENSPEYVCKGVPNREVFSAGVVDGEFKSEDILFCDKWCNLGGKIFCDTTVNLVHHGSKSYTGDFRTYLNLYREQIEQQALNNSKED